MLKTVNKKYYKRIDIPDLRRCGLQIDEAAIGWRYANNTVIIGYDKPVEVKRKDQEMLALAAKATQAAANYNPGPSSDVNMIDTSAAGAG